MKQTGMKTVKEGLAPRRTTIFKSLLKLLVMIFLMALPCFFVYLYLQNNLQLKTRFYNFEHTIDAKFSCETVNSTSLFPFPDEDYRKAAGVVGSVSRGGSRMSFEVTKDTQGMDTLRFLTDTSVGFGKMDPLQLTITTNNDSVLVASNTETAGLGNKIVHTVLINKKTNTGVWSKTNQEALIEFGPYNVVSYLLCN